MSQFTLPGGLAEATGTLITTIQGVQSSSQPEPFAAHDSPGTCPDWTIIKTGKPVPCNLVSPKCYIDFSASNADNSHVYHVEYQTYCKINVDSSVNNEDIEVVVYTNDGNLYFVICYDTPSNPSINEREISFTYSYTTAPFNHPTPYPTVEVYLYQEDPRTSRGTVTTVLVSRPGPTDALVNHENERTVNN